ncbi:hypothetical protein [Streptomyces sp. NPDC023838]|uniref:hypothetical protein n=1 Tax=Streptomyces sp. NPDC023838 TaxID=3154325 RepID=UPI0033DFB101
MSGGRLLAYAVASSMDEHARFGGVVPEIAARAHLQAFDPVVQEALGRAGLRLGVTSTPSPSPPAPGSPAALQVGVAGAKSLLLETATRLAGQPPPVGRAAGNRGRHHREQPALPSGAEADFRGRGAARTVARVRRSRTCYPGREVTEKLL